MLLETAILAADYGEAAALDVYGERDGLPPALCGQNQYFLWVPVVMMGALLFT
jgi:hypothetical protein